jgi:pyruvate/2-oxoglutarate dehydrogenase complex dihydrolipoamide dehydrogenase (E3) component
MNETLSTFDAIVVGAGQAGPSLAARLAAAGNRIAVVERHQFGGTCVNVGCTPTKSMVASAYVAHLARRGGDFGIKTSGPVDVDLKAVRERVDGIVGPRRLRIETWLADLPGCTIIRGHARFVAPGVLTVGDQRLTAPQIFLNVGGRAAAPALPGIDEIPWLSSTDILALDVIPKHLVVVGGSYVGLEFAQMFRRFGAAVSVVEKGPALVAREDSVVSAEIQAILEREGIAVRTRAECIHLAAHPDGALVGLDCETGDRGIVASHVLLAVGRRPNTDDLGLEAAGVQIDARGYIVVDAGLRTTAPGVWALGDCNGRGAFTHTAFNDFEIVAAELLDGVHRSVEDRIVSYALFIDPPLGRAGLTETQARATGHRVRVGERRMTRVSRAVEKGEDQGLMRIVVDADTDRILGAAILGPGGDEAVHTVLAAMGASLSASDLQRLVGIHPTVAELIPTIAGELGPVLDPFSPTR